MKKQRKAYPDLYRSFWGWRTPIDRLMCDTPLKIEYFPFEHRGVIRMQPCCCVDMYGAIRLFEAIDPEVRKINTYAGTETDTSYIRYKTGWQAFPAPRTRSHETID